MQTNFTAAQLRDPRIAEANAILRTCVHYGFCTNTCPTYLLTRDENESPRGRIDLIRAICTRRAVGWACQAVADERTALEAEIARLQAENVALKKELLARNLALPGTVKPGEPTPKSEEPPRLQLPSDAEFNKMMPFFDKVWRRLVAMIVTLQKAM